MTDAADPKYPFGFAYAEMDIGAFMNMRDWLQSALETKGAKITGGGIGCGQADLQITLDGMPYWVSIKPLEK